MARESGSRVIVFESPAGQCSMPLYLGEWYDLSDKVLLALCNMARA